MPQSLPLAPHALMDSVLADALSLDFSPLAIYYADQPPSESLEAKGKCAMIPIAQAAKGKTVHFTAASCSCYGASRGLGWTDPTQTFFPGGNECFEHFLSIGNAHWEHGKHVIKQMQEDGVPKAFIEMFSEGEGFFKTFELAKGFVDTMPQVQPEGANIVMQPFEQLKSNEKPLLVTMLVNADQLSALTTLTNYARPGNDNVRIPFGAGCMTFVLYPLHEAKQETPHAVVGLTDIAARLYTRKLLGKEYLSFTVPWALYEEMESNVPHSFLNRHTWKALMKNGSVS